MSKYISELHAEQARLRYQANPQLYRDRKMHHYEATLTPEELERLRIKREKHAQYMRGYYAAHPGYKSVADAKHRQKYLLNIRARDRWRNMQPERKANRLSCQRKRRELIGPELRQYAKNYYRNNKHKWKEKEAKLKLLPPEVRTLRHRKYSLKHSHGLTLEAYDAMLASQGGVCAICGTPPNIGFNKRLHVDHDHKTGVRRGLLCMHCNHAIERMDKFPDWHEKAALYLSKPR